MVASPYISGISSIEFEEKARQEIFKSLYDNKNNIMLELKKGYIDLKTKLNHSPSYEECMDYENPSFEPFYLFNKFSYPEFKQKYFHNDVEETSFLNEKELGFMAFFSKYLGFGTLIKELDFILLQIEKNKSTKEALEYIKDAYYFENINRFEIFKTRLTSFFNTNKKCKVLEEDLSFSKEFLICLGNINFRKELIDLLHYAKKRHEKIYKNTFKTNVGGKEVDTGFSLFQQYTSMDALQILDGKNYTPSTVYGYPSKPFWNFMPIFINANKKLNEDDNTNYTEGFIDNKTYIWCTRTNEKDSSKFLTKNLKVLVFIRLENTDNMPRYFLGVAKPTYFETQEKGGFKFILNFEQEIESDILTLIEANI